MASWAEFVAVNLAELVMKGLNPVKISAMELEELEEFFSRSRQALKPGKKAK